MALSSKPFVPRNDVESVPTTRLIIGKTNYTRRKQQISARIFVCEQ